MRSRWQIPHKENPRREHTARVSGQQDDKTSGNGESRCLSYRRRRRRDGQHRCPRGGMIDGWHETAARSPPRLLGLSGPRSRPRTATADSGRNPGESVEIDRKRPSARKMTAREGRTVRSRDRDGYSTPRNAEREAEASRSPNPIKGNDNDGNQASDLLVFPNPPRGPKPCR